MDEFPLSAIQVDRLWQTSQQHIETYTAQAQAFLNNFNSIVVQTPTFSTSWDTIAPPALPDLPAEPVLPEVSFNLPATSPEPLDEVAPDIVIDDFSATAPDIAFESPPTLHIGEAPQVATPREITLPEAPDIAGIDRPNYLSIVIPSFSGINLHTDLLELLVDGPSLNLAQPAEYAYTPKSLDQLMDSGFRDAIQSELLDRIANGGTGLPPAAEAAIWDRERARILAEASQAENEARNQFEAQGLAIPTGAFNAALLEARQTYHDRVVVASRDIAIKQAELEQSNIQQALTESIRLEGMLIQSSIDLERIAFESARTVAQNAIDIHNALLAEFHELLAAQQNLAAIYQAAISGERLKIDALQGQVAVEQAKASFNETLLKQLQAEIQLSLGQIQLYESEVKAASSLVDIEKIRVESSKTAIDGFVASVNGQTAIMEGYKSANQAKLAQAQVYESFVRAFAAKSDAQGRRAQALLARYEALARVKMNEWQAWSAEVDAEKSRVQAIAAQSGVKLEAYQAGTTAVARQAEMATRLWEGQVKQYEAQLQTAMQTAKMNNDAFQVTREIALHASQAGAQIYAQLSASAVGMVSANAHLSHADRWSFSRRDQSGGSQSHTDENGVHDSQSGSRSTEIDESWG